MTGEWREATLWDVAEYINGRATKPSELCSNGVPVIKIAELNRGITDATDRVPPDLVEDRHWVNPGDLLFAWSGSVGVYRYVGPRAALNQHIFRVVAKPGVDQSFLRYLLLSCVWIFELHAQDKRTTMGHVTKKDLQRIKVRVPPMPEQRAIAHILGTLDDKIELNWRMTETLEKMARAIFKAWFVDFEPVRAKMEGRWRRGESLPGLPAHLYDLFPDRLVNSELGEIPEGWEVGTVGDVLSELVSGSRPKGGATGVGVPSIGAENIIGLGRYNYSKEKYVPREFFEKLKARGADVRPGDVLLYKDGAHIGRKTYFDCNFPHAECAVNEHVLILRCRHRWLQRYLYFWLDLPWMTQEIVALNSSSAQPGINQTGVRHLTLLLPPDRVVQRFDLTAQPLLDTIFRNCHESRTLAALRDVLLPKLISGELRVKDAERFLEERGL